MSTISASSLLAGSSASSSISLSSLLQAATGSASSGIDVSAAVAAAVYAAQAPERQWQAQQASLKSQITALTSVQTALTTLSSDLNDLGSTSGSLAARSVTSSSASVTATASAGATIGPHTVAVTSLASAASWYSPALASSSATLGSSTLTITRADGTQTSFSNTSDLNSLAQSINASSAGVNASVITDASGSRLALVGASSGSANDFSVTMSTASAAAWTSAPLPSASAPLPASSFQLSDGTSAVSLSVNSGDTLATLASRINAQGLALTASTVTDATGTRLQILPTGSATLSVAGDPAFSLNRASSGANASLTVDGIPISSASNTVHGAVPGVTLQLTGLTPTAAPASISVAADTGTISAALSNFVKDFNSALSFVNSQFAFDSTSGSQGVLAGDSGIRSLQSSLLGMVGYAAGPGSALSSLAGVGITMADDGSLTLDQTRLNAALSNPSAVQNFFQGTALNGFAAAANTAVKQFGEPAVGSLAQEVSLLNKQYSELQTHVDDYESGYIAAQKTVLTAMYSKAEIALQELPTQLKQIQAQLGNNSGN